jgi:hypothetical protein
MPTYNEMGNNMFSRNKRATENVEKKNRSVKEFIKSRWRLIWYFVAALLLTVYIIYNWEAVISFTPFSDFDGNNLLFVVWIIVVSLPFIRIEFGKGKAGLDTGSNWDNKADAATAKNIKPPTSKEDEISEIEEKITEAKRGVGQ